MQLMIETTGVADRLSCPRSPPQGRYLGETIGAADALATIVALETDKLNTRDIADFLKTRQVKDIADFLNFLTTREFFGLTRGLFCPFIL